MNMKTHTLSYFNDRVIKKKMHVSLEPITAGDNPYEINGLARQVRS